MLNIYNIFIFNLIKTNNYIKKLILLLSVGFLLTHVSFAQDQETSKAELFSARSGTLIEQVSEDIGSFKGLKMNLLHYTDLTDDSKTSALRLDLEKGSLLAGTIKNKVNFLDADEIDGLVKSIEVIQSTIFPKKPDKQTEIRYKSKSGFTLGCFGVKINGLIF